METNSSNSDYISDKDRDDLDKNIITALENDMYDLAANYALSYHVADLADFVDRINDDQLQKLIYAIKDNINPTLLVEIENVSVKEKIVELIGAQKVAGFVAKLEISDAVELLFGLDEETKNAVLIFVDEEKRKQLDELFSYPDNSAGRIMQKKFVAVQKNWTVGQTIDRMRARRDLPKEFHEIFIVNKKYQPIASVTLGSLMYYDRDVILSNIMKTDLKIADTNIDQEEISYLFRQYGIVSIPVVNKIGRLVGVITAGDAVEVIEKTAEEDILHIGGINETDFHLEILEIVKSRFPWLFINLLTATIAAFVIQLFENIIEQVVVLASIMPVVASMGGNAGTQTMTVSLIAIIDKELTTLNSARVISKQIIACALNGFMVAVIGGVLMFFWHNSLTISLVFATAIIVNFSLAGFFGSSIPILINRLGLDPAIASPIFLTTLTDMFGFMIFLGLATFFLS